MKEYKKIFEFLNQQSNSLRQQFEYVEQVKLLNECVLAALEDLNERVQKLEQERK